MKILIIIPWYPDKKDKYNPSRGSFFEEQFNNLYKIVDITVLIINIRYAKDISNIKDIWSLEKKQEKDFPIYKLNAIYIPKLLKLTSKYISYFLSKSVIYPLIKEVDIIHSHVIYPSGAIGYELAKKFQKQFVLTEHISIFSNLIKSDYLKDVLLKTDYVTAVSNYLKNKIIAQGRDQCQVIPNYIDTTKYYSNQIQNNEIKFIHISSMAEVKNVDKLLEGFSLFLQRNTSTAKLVLLGGGININKYKKLATFLKLDNHVDFKGDVSNKILIEHLAVSNALIITSTVETFSVVGIEALASGSVVITTKCGGPEDYINSETGLFIENISKEAIANSLELYINNKNNYLPSKVKQLAYNQFDQSIIVEQLNNLYNGCNINDNI